MAPTIGAPPGCAVGEERFQLHAALSLEDPTVRQMYFDGRARSDLVNRPVRGRALGLV